MRATLLPMLAAMLCGCGVSSAIVSSETVSYDDAIEDITDKLLLLNILRAKDKATFHFDEVPSIHDPIQASASLQATFPFGGQPPAKSTMRNSFSPGLTVQVAPTLRSRPSRHNRFRNRHCLAHRCSGGRAGSRCRRSYSPELLRRQVQSRCELFRVL